MQNVHHFHGTLVCEHNARTQNKITAQQKGNGYWENQYKIFFQISHSFFHQ